MPMQTSNPRYQGMQQSTGQQQSQDAMQPVNDLYEYLRAYGRENPEALALWCFGIGFVIGWKLKPW